MNVDCMCLWWAGEAATNVESPSKKIGAGQRSQSWPERRAGSPPGTA